jgi:hypothetical protein
VIDERIAAAIDRAVTPAEIQHVLAGEIPASEREDVEALIRWFTSRYPTPEARLRNVRQAHARWRRSVRRKVDATINLVLDWTEELKRLVPTGR